MSSRSCPGFLGGGLDDGERSAPNTLAFMALAATTMERSRVSRAACAIWTGFRPALRVLLLFCFFAFCDALGGFGDGVDLRLGG